MNPLSRLIARRFLFSSRQRFVPLLTGIAFGGIALGVWSFLVVTSIMRGFQAELNDRWIGLNAHLTISKIPLQGSIYDELRKRLDQLQQIDEVAPYVEGEVIANVTQEGKTESVAAKLRGVEKISPFFLKRSRIYPLDVTGWETPEKDSKPSLMGGNELFATLGVHPDLEESVTLIYPFGEIGPTGDWVPHQREFQASHVFRTGLFEWDALRLLVPLQDAEALLGDQAERGLFIRLKSLSDLASMEKTLKSLVPPGAEVTSFAEQNARLFAALKLERASMMLLLVLFGLIASFSIAGLLLLFVDAKRRDLGVLRAIGLSIHGSRQIFLMLGAYLGGVGAIGGGLLGLATCFLLKEFRIPLPATYYLETLPVEVDLPWSCLVILIGLLLTALATLYPVKLAAHMDPLPMLREE